MPLSKKKIFTHFTIKIKHIVNALKQVLYKIPYFISLIKYNFNKTTNEEYIFEDDNNVRIQYEYMITGFLNKYYCKMTKIVL